MAGSTMLALMGTKKDTKPTGERPIKVADSTSLRLDDPMRNALLAFLRAQRIPPSVPSVIEQALIEFLTREGFPPDYSQSPG